jgi:hypothetical protein
VLGDIHHVADRSTRTLCHCSNPDGLEPFFHATVQLAEKHRRKSMYSIVWLVGAVVIVIAILNLIGMA